MDVDDRKQNTGGCGFVVAGVVLAGLVIGALALSCSSPRKKHTDLNIPDETAFGKKAVPAMIARYGGEDPDKEARQLVAEVGGDLVDHSEAKKSGYAFQFHDLADEQTIDAFSLPGGQVFITHGFLTHLASRGQLAAVLAHECGHVIERHSLDHVGSDLEPSRLLDISFSPDDELEADRWAVTLTSEAGYDPRAILEVLDILSQPGLGATFFASHPSPVDRVDRIKREIAKQFPNGVPPSLKR